MRTTHSPEGELFGLINVLMIPGLRNFQPIPSRIKMATTRMMTRARKTALVFGVAIVAVYLFLHIHIYASIKKLRTSTATCLKVILSINWLYKQSTYQLNYPN